MVNELTVLTSIHVLAAVFWVGGGFLLNIAMTVAPRSGDPAMRLAALRLADFVGLKVFLPLAAIVMGTGIWMTADYYDFSYLWITLGMIGLVTAITIVLVYIRPRGRRAIEAIEAGAGPPPPGTRNWVPIVSRLNLLLVSAIVVIMVIKPT